MLARLAGRRLSWWRRPRRLKRRFAPVATPAFKESLAISERHLHTKQPPVGTQERAFDAALLIAIREKELGIPGDASMTKPLRLLTSASPSSVAQGKPATVLRQAVLDAAQLMIGDTTGLDAEQRSQMGPRTRPQLELDNPRRRALDTTPGTDLAAKYVALAIDCEQPKLAESVDLKGLLSAYEGVPLMRFRLAICGRPGSPDAGALRAADPRWTDTVYWEGRRELASSIGRAIDLPKVLSLYAEGRDAFPSSVMLIMAWANANMIGEEFEGALSGFDDVLASQPAHRAALNGRMQSLSYLLRHEDAVATATRLLDLGTWHIADANYWRAWNRYHHEKSAQSAFNAAQCYARIGQKRMALNLIDVAIAHPKMSEKATAMKAAIEKLPD